MATRVAISDKETRAVLREMELIKEGGQFAQVVSDDEGPGTRQRGLRDSDDRKEKRGRRGTERWKTGGGVQKGGRREEGDRKFEDGRRGAER